MIEVNDWGTEIDQFSREIAEAFVSKIGEEMDWVALKYSRMIAETII